MPELDSTYLTRVSSRIIRMFETYVRNINPDDEQFKAFIAGYVTQKGVKNPQTLPYSELYKVIKDGIREYLKQQQAKTRFKK